MQLIAVPETWLKTRHTNWQVNLNGLKVFRSDRGRGRCGGGMTLYLGESMRYKVVAFFLKPTSFIFRVTYRILLCTIKNPSNLWFLNFWPRIEVRQHISSIKIHIMLTLYENAKFSFMTALALSFEIESQSE
jgi:hypothetical protein